MITADNKQRIFNQVPLLQFFDQYAETGVGSEAFAKIVGSIFAHVVTARIRFGETSAIGVQR